MLRKYMNGEGVFFQILAAPSYPIFTFSIPTISEEMYFTMINYIPCFYSRVPLSLIEYYQ